MRWAMKVALELRLMTREIDPWICRTLATLLHMSLENGR